VKAAGRVMQKRFTAMVAHFAFPAKNQQDLMVKERLK
jgi:hypothetical protein